MKLNTNILTFAGILIVSLAVSAAATNIYTIPDSAIYGNVQSIRGIMPIDFSGDIESDTRNISRGMSVTYIMNVNITGSPTYSYSGNLTRTRIVPVMLNSDLDAKGINLQMVNGIVSYAQTTWGATFLSKDLVWRPYSKGS